MTFDFEKNKELLEEFYEYVNTIKESGDKGMAMPILQKMQDLFGYIPKEVLLETSKMTNIPSSELYGIATFYHQFTFNPKGTHKIQICLGTACYVKGSGAILQRFEELLQIKDGHTSDDGMYSIDTTRCIGDCEKAPVVIIDDVLYPKVSLEEVDQIVAKLNGGVA